MFNDVNPEGVINCDCTETHCGRSYCGQGFSTYETSYDCNTGEDCQTVELYCGC
ncbi:MAG: hypothetical protein H0Z32_12065 [Bacillaceae bacterium]|nr:hypothetical protein [Bacillaceae bacterium]